VVLFCATLDLVESFFHEDDVEFHVHPGYEVEFELLLEFWEDVLALYEDYLGSSLMPKISLTAVLLLANFSNTGDFFGTTAVWTFEAVFKVVFVNG